MQGFGASLDIGTYLKTQTKRREPALALDCTIVYLFKILSSFWFEWPCSRSSCGPRGILKNAALLPTRFNYKGKLWGLDGDLTRGRSPEDALLFDFSWWTPFYGVRSLIKMRYRSLRCYVAGYLWQLPAERLKESAGIPGRSLTLSLYLPPSGSMRVTVFTPWKQQQIREVRDFSCYTHNTCIKIISVSL